MSVVTAWHLDGDRFAIAARDHLITVDQPLPDGGEDSAPTPTELFAASLAGCVAFYARRFLHRHQLPTEGLATHVEYELGGRPARVTRIEIRLDVPEGVPQDRRRALQAVASHCTISNTLVDPPPVHVRLSTVDDDRTGETA